MTRRPGDAHRTIILSTRLSPDEHAALLDAAARAGLPPSSYLRQSALGAKLTVRSFLSLDPADLVQLKRLGNLLNQIARAGWRGRFSQPMEDALAAVLLELKIALRKLSRERLEP